MAKKGVCNLEKTLYHLHILDSSSLHSLSYKMTDWCKGLLYASTLLEKILLSYGVRFYVNFHLWVLFVVTFIMNFICKNMSTVSCNYLWEDVYCSVFIDQEAGGCQSISLNSTYLSPQFTLPHLLSLTHLLSLSSPHSFTLHLRLPHKLNTSPPLSPLLVDVLNLLKSWNLVKTNLSLQLKFGIKICCHVKWNSKMRRGEVHT